MNARREHRHDPRGLIREAYRIEGIDEAGCRAVFFDWALGLPASTDPGEAARELALHHADEPRDHPMTRLLLEAAAGMAAPRGRTGRRRRD